MENTLPPGVAVVPDLDSDVYHAHPAISSTGLKQFAISPMHYWAAYLDPEREDRDKKAFRIGRAWHCAVFEPDEFEARFATNHDAHPATKRAALLQSVLVGEVDFAKVTALPQGLSLTTKEGKGLVAEIEADGRVPATFEDVEFVRAWLPRLAGRDVLQAEAMAKVRRMAALMRAHPISQVVFGRYGAVGRAEQSLFATCQVTGVLRKIRPDYMLQPCEDFPHGLIIDGKSTTDASPDGFARQVWNLDYGLQAAFYTRVFQDVFRTRERPAFLWAAQEKESPFACAYYAAGADLIEHYDRRIAAMLPVFEQCQRLDVWPGYSVEVGTLQMPAWAQKQMEGQS